MGYTYIEIMDNDMRTQEMPSTPSGSRLTHHSRDRELTGMPPRERMGGDCVNTVGGGAHFRVVVASHPDREHKLIRLQI